MKQIIFPHNHKPIAVACCVCFVVVLFSVLFLEFFVGECCVCADDFIVINKIIDLSSCLKLINTTV